MKRLSKVLLTTFQALLLTTLMSGCSTLQHADGTAPEQIRKFQTGTPTQYEKERIQLVDHLKRQREKDLIDSQRNYQGTDSQDAMMRQGESSTAQGTETTTGKAGIESAFIPSPDAGRPKVKPIITGIVHGAGYKPLDDESGQSVVDTSDLAQLLHLNAPLVVAAVISGPVEVTHIEESREPTKSMLRQQFVQEPEPPVEVAEEIPAEEAMPESEMEPEIIAVPEPVSGDMPEVAAEKTTHGDPKIKVVSGDGMPLSAKQLSGRMKEMGYDVDRVDIAPFSFEKPTVFYAPGFKDSAKGVAGDVKATGGIKPMTWNSVYDIIVVSVN